MLHFAVGIYQALFSVPEYRILIIGHGGSGKSVLMEQLKYMYHPNNTSTEGGGGGSLVSSPAAATAPAAETSSSPSPMAANGRDEANDGLDALRSALRRGKGQAEVSSPQSPLERSTTVAKLPPPAGTPLPAPPSYLAAKRIRPTVGMNYAKISHYYSPLPLLSSHSGSGGGGGGAVGLPQSSPPPPKAGFRSLVLWDLGGDRALRALWSNYYPQCQAIIYVVDGNSYHEARDKAADTPPLPVNGRGASVRPAEEISKDVFTAAEKQRAKAVYAETSKTIEGLLMHPQLQGVPLLVLSNKADLPSHIPLAELQEALDLADLAVRANFYNSSEGHAQRTTTGGTTMEKKERTEAEGTTGPHVLTPSATGSHSTGKDGGPAIGTSGFGSVVMRLVEVSALDGTGVALGLDWLVAQLERGAREVEREEK